MQANITITTAAADYLAKMLAKNADSKLRLSVKKTGCSGYSYAPSLVKEINKTDLQIEQQGIQLYIDIAWLDLLNNLTIDYTEDNKNGIKQKRLVFINPKEANRCGCGESFNL